MSKKDQLFNFEGGFGWDNMAAERAVETIVHLHPAMKRLEIQYALYGSKNLESQISTN